MRSYEINKNTTYVIMYDSENLTTFYTGTPLRGGALWTPDIISSVKQFPDKKSAKKAKDKLKNGHFCTVITYDQAKDYMNLYHDYINYNEDLDYWEDDF